MASLESTMRPSPLSRGNQWRERPLGSNLLLHVASRNSDMSRFAPLFTRRVPLYISLPVIVACGAAGLIASTMRLGDTIAGQVAAHRSAEPSQAPVMASSALHQPRNAPSIAVPPTAEMDLPTPAPRVVGRSDQVPEDVVESTPLSIPVTTSPPQRTKAARTERSVVKARRAQRTAQQPAVAPSKSSASLKNVPLIGPVFALFQ